MLYLRIYNSLEEKEKDNIIVSPTISFIKRDKSIIIDNTLQPNANFVDNVLMLYNATINDTTLVLPYGSFVNNVLML